MGWTSGSATDESPRRVRRRRRRSGIERQERVGGLLLAVAIVGSALGFGAQHTPVLLVSALAAAGAAMLLSPARTTPGTWLLTALAGYCLLQLLPLPFGVVAWLSPSAAGVWQGAFAPFGERAPRFITLSVDPGATALEVLKWSAYACVLAAATGLRQRRRSVALTLLVFGSALAVCVVTLAHGALNLERIYGIFLPTDSSRWVRGPFVNGNNLAGYLNLGLFAGAGLAISKRATRLGPVLVPGVLLLAVGSFLASSRAGTVSLLLGALLYAYLLSRQRWGTPRRVALLASTVVLTGFALSAAVSGRRVFSTLLDTQVKAKLSIWLWTLDVIRDFPLFGVGRGGFDTAFQPYRHPVGLDWATIYVHAENFPLEWAAEWGVPVAVAALCALGFLARRAIRRAFGDPIAAGLVTGLGVLALQNLADLGLELFSVMATAIVAFAAADEPIDSAGRASLLRVPQIAVAAAATLVIGLGAAVPQVDRAHTAVAYGALAKAPRDQILEFQRSLRAAVRRHPGDAYLPLLGGLAAERLGQDPLPWLGRALERSPLDGKAHLALSDVLARHRATKQSLMHARFAALYDGQAREQALTRIAARAHVMADLLDAFPEGMPGSQLLAATCPKVRPELGVECWREAVSRNPTPEAQQALAVALSDALERAGTPCAGSTRDPCVAEALHLLDQLDKHDGGADWQLSRLRANLAALAGDARHAALMLVERCPGSGDTNACYAQALEFAAASNDPMTLEAVARPYVAAACGEPATCGAVHERSGRLLVAMNASQLALHHFLDAAKASPSLERWLLTAETAARLESHVAAELALERAQREPEIGEPERARIAAVRALLAPAPPE